MIIRKGILIAFGEMFLKSKGVRSIFQKRLVQNLCFFLKKEKIDFKIYSFRERIFIALSAEVLLKVGRRRETEKVRKAVNIIKNIFGIAWFSQCFFLSETNLKELSEFIEKNYKDWIEKDETFAIRLKIEKDALKDEKEKIIEKIAENIERKVNLSKPDKEIFIEIRKIGWFSTSNAKRSFAGWIYFKKTKGSAGLPSGSGGKVLTLISGGIDSPVASYLSVKRGAYNIWLHFHSFPLVSRKSIEKIEELAEAFLKYQKHLKIYFIPFSEAQSKIKLKAPAKYRVILYRRLMFKIAEEISRKENCSALITGESLGQVSSQTLPNIKIIEEAVKIPVLRPLICLDKEEIIKLARKIKTYQISIKPQEDCCTLFVSKGQTAEGNFEIVKEIEKKLKINKIIKEVIKGIEIKRY